MAFFPCSGLEIKVLKAHFCFFFFFLGELRGVAVQNHLLCLSRMKQTMMEHSIGTIVFLFEKVHLQRSIDICPVTRVANHKQNLDVRGLLNLL